MTYSRTTPEKYPPVRSAAYAADATAAETRRLRTCGYCDAPVFWSFPRSTDICPECGLSIHRPGRAA